MKPETIRIDPEEKFSLSPYLFMQLMEPLGATDSSVEAAWDYREDRWREDFIRTSKKLGPTLIRWPGGCLSSYYRWKEGIGPREKRKPMHNICWGGMESNQVGTHEYIDYCRLIGADPLIGINLESDGRAHWASFKGQNRSGGPAEAAAWVDYCNNPSNILREKNGAAEPFNVKLWQLGNETSYDPMGFDVETAARRSAVFAKTMRKADPGIKLIGWGCSGWAPRMLEIAGEHFQYIAFHHHFPSGLEKSPLQWTDYRNSAADTWRHLMHGYKSTEARIGEMREQVAGYDVKLALTESHFSAAGRNRCEVLASWGAGVAYARILNVHERNGDILDIATLADFCGTRWMTSAIILCQPEKKSYLMPVARVMSLYRKQRGKKEVTVEESSGELDVTASRTGSTVYLHVANTNRTKPVKANIKIDSMKIVSGKVYTIAADPAFEVDQHNDEELEPKVHTMRQFGSWEFPAASVSVVKMTVSKKK